MKSNNLRFVGPGILLGFLGFLMIPTRAAIDQEQPQKQSAPGPVGAKEVTVTEIPGVVAAGAKWQLVWAQNDVTNGLVSTIDGSVLFIQKQPDIISKIDEDDKYSIFSADMPGTVALATDTNGGVYGLRGGGRGQLIALWELAPEQKLLVNQSGGDLEVAKDGGIYISRGNAIFYYNSSSGKLSLIGFIRRIRGMILSPDEKTLYVNHQGNNTLSTISALDMQPDGSRTTQPIFARLDAPAGGMAVDSMGRVYVAMNPYEGSGRVIGHWGIQVFGADGSYLGTIPTPRLVVRLAFSGPGKKWLYAQAVGAVGPDGKEIAPETVGRYVTNDARSIYKIEMLSEGYKDRTN